MTRVKPTEIKHVASSKYDLYKFWKIDMNILMPRYRDLTMGRYLYLFICEIKLCDVLTRNLQINVDHLKNLNLQKIKTLKLADVKQREIPPYSEVSKFIA